jgi:hypothetical protein
MRVNVPFLYPVVIMDNDGEVQAFEGDWAELEIYDASDAQQLCAIEGFTVEGIPYEIDVRKVGDQFYRPRLSVSSTIYAPIEDGSDRVTTQNLGAIIRTFHFGNGNAQQAFPDRLDQIVGVIDRPKRGPLVRDGREEAVATLEEAVRGLVVVDGQIWEPCGEPKIIVDIFWSPATVSVVFSGPETRPASGYTSLFPVDQADVMRAMVEEASVEPRLLVGQQHRPGRAVAEGRNPWTMADVPLPMVTYSDPSLLADPTLEAIASAKRGLLDILSRTSLERYTRPFIMAWVDFRDSVEAVEEQADELRMEEMFESWQIANDVALREPILRNGNMGMGEIPAERMRSRYEMEAYRARWRGAVAVPGVSFAQDRQPQLG